MTPNYAVGRLLFNVLAMIAEFESGEHSTAELADLFGVGRSTVYRAEQRHLSATAPDRRRPSRS